MELGGERRNNTRLGRRARGSSVGALASVFVVWRVVQGGCSALFAGIALV